jgi:cobyrinic acid a,c-diamide synthase
MIHALLVAGVSSGVGKTTVTLGLLEALRRRGLTIQAFKVGPDFIDPGFHARITGRPSYSLDGWMCPRESVLATVARQAAGTDLTLVEGVMGCFDGLDGRSEEGSTAQVAKWLGAPVILVVDAHAMARSAGAVVVGFERFDPELDLAGVIFNRVAGETHYRWLRQALEGNCRATPLGFLPRRESLALPERHLGLVTVAEEGLSGAFLDELAGIFEECVDLDRLLSLARSHVVAASAEAMVGAPHGRTLSESRAHESRDRMSGGPETCARIGVAWDRAFQFYYPANFDLLRAAGATLVFWSPLQDAGLPNVDALYFGGGYPEVYVAGLSSNQSMLEAVGEFARSGQPVYAECGGLMYLAEALEDEAGDRHRMVGLLPATVRMTRKRLTLGYTEVEVVRNTPLAPAGTVLRGHEFHASRLEEVPASVPRAYTVRMRSSGVPRAEGYLVGRTLMSYVHVHFGSNPRVAEHLVASCRRGA